MFTMASADASPSLITPTVSDGEVAPTSLPIPWPALILGSLSVNAASTSGAASLPSVDLSSFAGFASVPPKVIKKIVGKEYVDIRELLPETWQVELENSPCCHSKRPRRSLITEFNVWAEGYATTYNLFRRGDGLPFFPSTIGYFSYSPMPADCTITTQN